VPHSGSSGRAQFCWDFFLQLWTEVTTGIWILPNEDVGPGLFLGHFGDVVVGYCKLGKFCNISNGNSFGFAGRGDKRGIPEIGDFVYEGPGADIIGKIKIGNHAAIGANAVVTKVVPENAVVAGVPAQINNFKSSVNFVEFNRIKSAEFRTYTIIAEIVDCLFIGIAA
jgi:serine O-acetyltransferase